MSSTSDKAISQMEALVQTQAKTGHLLTIRAGKIHENIVNLKAYCLAVQDKVSEMSDHKTSSIMPFIDAFGKDSKAEKSNAILEYAKLYVKIAGEYESGMGFYLMTHLNKAIMSGEGIIGMNAEVGNKFVLKYQTLGLEALPKYMKRLGISISAYDESKRKVAALNAHAEATAAAEYLKGKHNNAVVAFLAMEQAKVDSLAPNRAHLYKAAYAGEQHAYDISYEGDSNATQQHVQVQAGAGIEAAMSEFEATKANTYVPPTAEEIEARAKEAAAKYMFSLEQGEDTTAAVLTNAENEEMGITVRYSTSQKLAAESTMQPTIHVKGSKGELQTTLQVVPLPSEELTQTFPSDHLIGEIESVTISATSDDPWGCEEFHIKVGKGPEITMAKKLFWVDQDTTADHFPYQSGAQVTLTPETKSSN